MIANPAEGLVKPVPEAWISVQGLQVQNQLGPLLILSLRDHLIDCSARVDCPCRHSFGHRAKCSKSIKLFQLGTKINSNFSACVQVSCNVGSWFAAARRPTPPLPLWGLGLEDPRAHLDGPAALQAT